MGSIRCPARRKSRSGWRSPPGFANWSHSIASSSPGKSRASASRSVAPRPIRLARPQRSHAERETAHLSPTCAPGLTPQVSLRSRCSSRFGKTDACGRLGCPTNPSRAPFRREPWTQGTISRATPGISVHDRHGQRRRRRLQDAAGQPALVHATPRRIGLRCQARRRPSRRRVPVADPSGICRAAHQDPCGLWPPFYLRGSLWPIVPFFNTRVCVRTPDAFH